MAIDKNNLTDSALQAICRYLVLAASQGQILKDQNIAQDSTYSSHKIEALVAKCLQDGKDYSDALIGAISHLTIEKVTTEPTMDNTEVNKIYLYSSTGTYPYTQTLRLESELVDLGDTNIDMSQFYTKTDADDKFIAKSDFTSVIGDTSKLDSDICTDLDAVKNKPGIVRLHKSEYETLVSTGSVVTEDGRNLTYDKDAFYCTDDEEQVLLDIGKVVTTDKLVTNISSASTDTEVPSAKSIYDISGLNIFTEEDVKSFGNNTFLSGFVNKTIASTVIPDATDHYNLIKLPWSGNYNTQIWIAASGKQKAYIQYAKNNGVWDTPKMICTTTVADVPLTSVTFSDSTNYSLVGDASNYFIKNGICTIKLNIKCETPTAWATVANVPKPDKVSITQMLISIDGTSMIRCIIKTDGSLEFNLGTAGTSYIGTFSYLVAE